MGRHHAVAAAPSWQHLALGLAVAATAAGAGAALHVLDAAPAAASTVAPSAGSSAAPAAPVATVATAAPVAPAAPESHRYGGVAAVCDLSGPPVFGDPAHPNVITNRHCGYTDERGRTRSHDAWLDGQLLAAAAR